jgi:hypothetical protein
MSLRSLRSLFLGRGAVVSDPTADLQAEAAANPEDDNVEERIISREREDIERTEEGFPSE